MRSVTAQQEMPSQRAELKHQETTNFLNLYSSKAPWTLAGLLPQEEFIFILNYGEM